MSPSARVVLTVQEAGLRLRRTRIQLERLAMLGELRVERRGHRLFYSADSVAAFAAKEASQ